MYGPGLTTFLITLLIIMLNVSPSVTFLFKHLLDNLRQIFWLFIDPMYLLPVSIFFLYIHIYIEREREYTEEDDTVLFVVYTTQHWRRAQFLKLTTDTGCLEPLGYLSSIHNILVIRYRFRCQV